MVLWAAFLGVASRNKSEKGRGSRRQAPLAAVQCKAYSEDAHQNLHGAVGENDSEDHSLRRTVNYKLSFSLLS